MAKKRSHSSSKSSSSTQVSDRKAKRKEKRLAKKRKTTNLLSKNSNTNNINEHYSLDESQSVLNNNNIEHKKHTSTKSKNDKKKKSASKNVQDEIVNQDDYYDNIDPSLAAAMRRDDEEIAQLEKSLGISSSSMNKGGGKKKLNKEYAKLEGYGDDFGDFLDGLDGMVGRLHGSDGNDEEMEGEYDMDDLEYDSDESDPMVARAKALLRLEAAGKLAQDDADFDDDNDDEDDDGEELVPMKDPEVMEDESDASSSSEDNHNDDNDDSSNNSEESDNDDDGNNADTDEDDDEEGAGSSQRATIADCNPDDTYTPTSGQDLYGNIVDKTGEEAAPKKYVPPHLRNQNKQTNKSSNDDDDPERKEKLRAIQRLLNNSLNRLSDNTLESVVKSISTLYSSNEYSTQDLNDLFWKNIRSACVASHIVMSGLIPVYVACISGVHFQLGDSVQFGGFVLENVVLELWELITKSREQNGNGEESTDNDQDQNLMDNKEGPNLMLILCYLYNYGVAHCTLMYDVIRNLIESFAEIDVELLLMILSHSGHQLRIDDPSSLKDIVLLVQERALASSGSSSNSDSNAGVSSRAQHMIEAITDLKNNKRRKKDISLAEKTGFYRKIIGRIKSSTALMSSGGRSSGSNCLRITLEDVLNIETKGRWWKVGASWMGNQFHNGNSQDEGGPNYNDGQEVDSQLTGRKTQKKSKEEKKQEKLLKLAAKQRMNTDERRSIFCIIMGSDDCEDAFEKIIRAGMMKGKTDREVVRVIVHCCGQEKAYNPYYSHLAGRVCEYQPKCKFTFQLTFWDAFKQFDTMKARKAANLAKMLAYLLMSNHLNLNALKTIDISPEDMSEAATIFLTILFSTIFEKFDDTVQVIGLFRKGAKNIDAMKDFDESDDLVQENDHEALQQNITVFLLHFLKEHPKNVKNSQFRKNYKAAVKACDNDGLDMMI